MSESKCASRLAQIAFPTPTLGYVILSDGTVLRVDHASLRFLDVPALGAFLAGADFVIQAQYGDWHRGPITDASREIVTMARRI